MKRISIEELPEKLGELETSTAEGVVLITRNGKPAYFVRDASNYDEEDIEYMTDESFWKMIAERMKQPTVPASEVLNDLEERERREGIRK